MANLPQVSSGDPHPAAHNAERAQINQNTTDILKRIEKPATPKTGDTLRFDGTKWVTAKSRLFEDVGDPNGRFAAPIGSRYIDTASATGAIEWVKRFGDDTSTTGWVLSSYSDTGWRNVAADVNLKTGSICHVALLRRANDFVDFYLDVTTPNNTDTWTVYDLPVGFRPDFDRYGGLQDNKEGASGSTGVFAGGNVNLYTLTRNKRDRYQGQWTTRRAWPTVLPGSALA